MKQLIVIYCFLFYLSSIILISHSYAQITFQKTFGGSDFDIAYSVQQTADGGYIVAGVTESFGSSSDAYLIKTDSTGNILWAKTYGDFGDSVNYGAQSVQQTTEGGYIVSGSVSENNGDIYLFKTDIAGNILWSKTYGTTGGIDAGRKVLERTDGDGYTIIGQAELIGAGGSDAYLIKTDTNGNFSCNSVYGGTLQDFGYDIIENSQGFIVVVGATESYGVGGTCAFLPCRDVYVFIDFGPCISITPKTFGGAGDDYGRAIQETNDKGYIIAGYTSSFGAGLEDIYLIKTDSLLDTLWTKTYGGSGNDYAYSIEVTSDGGYIIAGTTNSFGGGSTDIYMIKTDSMGDTLWTKTYGGTGAEWGGYTIQQTSDGGYITVGYTNSFGSGNNDIYLIKTDANGNSNSCNQYNTTTIVGNTSTQINTGGLWNAGGSVNAITTIANNAVTIESLLCINCDISLTTDSLPDISNTGVGMAWVTVSGGTPPYSYQWDDPASQTTDTASSLQAGTYKVVVTDSNGCIDSSGVTVSNITGISDQELKKNDVQIYPNPNTGELVIEMNFSKVQDVEITLFSITGQVIYNEDLKQFKGVYFKLIDIKGLSTGIYQLQIKTGYGVVNKKVVVE